VGVRRPLFSAGRMARVGGDCRGRRVFSLGEAAGET
jgi:hypothetical protein